MGLGGWAPRFEVKGGLGKVGPWKVPWKQQERKSGDGTCFKEEADLSSDPGWIVLSPREPDLAESPGMLFKPILPFFHSHLLNIYWVSGFMPPAPGKPSGWQESLACVKSPSTTEQCNLGRPGLTQAL